MEVRELTREEFEDFTKSHYSNPMQTVEMADRMAKQGRNPRFFGGYEDGKLVIAALFGDYKIKKVMKYMYSPYGYMADNPMDTKMVREFFQGVADLARDSSLVGIRFDGYFELNDETQEYRKNLEKEGFMLGELEQVTKFDRQSRIVTVLDLAELENYHGWFGKDVKPKRFYTEDELWKNMNLSTRNHTRQSMRPYIHLRDATVDEVADMCAKSAENKGFAATERDMIEGVMDAFGDKCKSWIAVLDTDEFIGFAKERIQEKDDRLAEIQVYLDKNPNAKKKQRQFEVVTKEKEQAMKLLKEAEDLKASTQLKEIPLAAAMFLYSDYEVFYLFSGMDRTYARYNGSNRLQWETIQEAMRRGLWQYNMLGIAGFGTTPEENKGLVEFKDGLGGRNVEYTGVATWPVMPKWMVSQILKPIA